jgi:hypothetical protein
MRKIFSLLLLPLILGACYEYAEDRLVPFYRNTKDLYLGKQNGSPLKSQFKRSRKKLSKLVNRLFSSNPTELFNVLHRITDRRLTHYIFGLVISIISPDPIDDRDIWKEHLDPSINSAISFFKRSRTLMRSLCKNDKSVVKETLPVILSIQKRYLHHLRDNVEKLDEAKMWIGEYEYISHTFKPGNLNILLKLYKDLRAMATIYEGEIPKAGKESFLVQRALNLFKIYCYQMYNNHWRELEGYKFTAIPKGLLYLIMIELSKETNFIILEGTESGLISDFFIFNYEFNDLKKIFERKSNTKEKVLISDFLLKDNPQFADFLRNSIKPQGNAYKLREKQLWIIEAFFYVLPILEI